MAQLLQKTVFLISLIVVVLVGLPARTETTPAKPVAIIEDIQAEGVDFEPQDLVYEGKIIALGYDGTLKLAYLRSCIVEELKGGTVTVGRTQSELANPNQLTRQTTVKCDGGGIVPTEGQDEDAAGIAIRGPPPVNVHSTMPVFVFVFIEPAKELIIKRVNPGEEEEYRIAVHGVRLDLADQPVRLVAGGHYRATSGERFVLFLISHDATESSSNVISRLVVF
jgi:hypothetical protein